MNDHLIKILLRHFEYSIHDINRYEELTSTEKQIISKDDFEQIVNCIENESICH